MKDNHKADVSHTNEFDKMYQEMVKQVEDKYKVKSEYPETEKEGLAEDEMIDLTSIVMETVEEKTIQNALAYGYNLPDGYQFKDENGNVINATKIVLEKKKPEYPKTYEECCEALEYIPHTDDIIGYKWNILQSLQKLLICRDAYWKLYGEEMGLGKPWEPDWTIESSKYIVLFKEAKIEKHITCKYSRVFAFPTEEMRDAFYENFKELIEMCKELL